MLRETTKLRDLAKASMMIAGEIQHDQAEELPEIKASIYYTVTLLLFALETGLGATLPDVDIVFNFIAAIAVSCLGFAFPALFFFKAESLYYKEKLAEGNRIHRKCAWLHIVLALVVFGLCLYAAITEIIE